jgi:hypothetical protein
VLVQEVSKNEDRAFFKFSAAKDMLVLLEPEGLPGDASQYELINQITTLSSVFEMLEESGTHRTSTNSRSKDCRMVGIRIPSSVGSQKQKHFPNSFGSKPRL